MMGYGMMGGFGFMFLIPVLLIGAIIYAVIQLSDGNHHRLGSNIHYQESNRALNLLNEKFANGEMTEEEYLRKKDLINNRNI